MAKKITMTLSSSSIDRAISELRAYQSELNRKAELLRVKVAEYIAELAQDGFDSAVVEDLVEGSPRLANVSVSVDNRENVSVVVATGEDAIWVEFGAGVFHNGNVGTSPHPKGSELGFTIGSYGKGHGGRKTWGFYDGAELILTHGTPATMPMYTATKMVSEEIYNIAKGVFG